MCFRLDDGMLDVLMDKYDNNIPKSVKKIDKGLFDSLSDLMWEQIIFSIKNQWT